MDILCIYFLFQPVLCSCLLCFCLATLPSNSLFKIKYCLVKRTHVLSSLAMKSMVNRLKEKNSIFSAKTFTFKSFERNEVIVYPQVHLLLFAIIHFIRRSILLRLIFFVTNLYLEYLSIVY